VLAALGAYPSNPSEQQCRQCQRCGRAQQGQIPAGGQVVRPIHWATGAAAIDLLNGFLGRQGLLLQDLDIGFQTVPRAKIAG
jgi:hypothetical protein